MYHVLDNLLSRVPRQGLSEGHSPPREGRGSSPASSWEPPNSLSPCSGTPPPSSHRPLVDEKIWSVVNGGRGGPSQQLFQASDLFGRRRMDAPPPSGSLQKFLVPPPFFSGLSPPPKGREGSVQQPAGCLPQYSFGPRTSGLGFCYETEIAIDFIYVFMITNSWEFGWLSSRGVAMAPILVYRLPGSHHLLHRDPMWRRPQWVGGVPSGAFHSPFLLSSARPLGNQRAAYRIQAALALARSSCFGAFL